MAVISTTWTSESLRDHSRQLRQYSQELVRAAKDAICHAHIALDHSHALNRRIAGAARTSELGREAYEPDVNRQMTAAAVNR